MSLGCRLLAVLTLTAGLLRCAQPPAALTPAREAAIRDSVRDALDAFQRYSASGQWDSLASLYSTAPGFRFAESGTIPYPAAEAIRTALHRIPAGTTIETTYEEPQLDVVAPGVAVLTARFQTAFVDSGGGRFAFGGAVTVVWVHEAAGWRIRAGHSSAPVPRPP